MNHILSAVLGESGRKLYFNTSASSWFQKQFFAMADYLPCYHGHELQHKERGELVGKYVHLTACFGKDFRYRNRPQKRHNYINAKHDVYIYIYIHVDDVQELSYMFQYRKKYIYIP